MLRSEIVLFYVGARAETPQYRLLLQFASREKLYGGSLFGPITPVAVQGPWFCGSLVPVRSPAKARSSPFVSDLNM